MTSAASLSILGVSFSAAQEYTRTLTGTESPINSAVGGAAAGALLFASHGGNPVLGAAIVAVLGGAGDAASSAWKGSAAEDDREDREDREGRRWSLWPSSLVRKTSEEERQQFLEQRRRRIQREDA